MGVMQQTWFITGSWRGLGRAIVKTAHDAGDLVAATARHPAQLDDLVAEHGKRIHAIALDVTDPQAAHSAQDRKWREVGRSADFSEPCRTPSRPLLTRRRSTQRCHSRRRPTVVDYHGPSRLPKDSFAFNGIWTDHSEEATASAKAEITLNFTANDVYLVIGGAGTVGVSLDGHHLSTLDVKGVPRLYTLFSGESLVTGELEIDFSPRVKAYDFTFG